MTPHYHSPRAVLSAALLETDVTLGELLGKSRHAEIVEARRNVAYSMRTLGRASYPQIARAFGRTSHSAAWRQVSDGRNNGGAEFAARVRARLEGKS